MKTRLTLTVNGEPREVLVPVHKTLLEVLREDLDLTGTSSSRDSPLTVRLMRMFIGSRASVALTSWNVINRQ